MSYGNHQNAQFLRETGRVHRESWISWLSVDLPLVRKELCILIATVRHILTHENIPLLDPSLTHVSQDQLSRVEKQAELDALSQEIEEALARIMQDDDTQTEAERYSNEIDHLKKYIDRKQEETQRMINSVSRFVRAVGAVSQTPQYTQVSEDSGLGESSDSKDEEEEDVEGEQAVDADYDDDDDDTEMVDAWFGER
jgi:hypothetical protein